MANIKQEAEKIIADFNKEMARKVDKINANRSIVFHVVSILTRLDYLEKSIHSAKQYGTYQNELSKIKPMIGKIDKVTFSTATGKVTVSSKLFISSLLGSLDFKQSKKSKGGRPTNEDIQFCTPQIEGLRSEGVSSEFISRLFKMNKETFDRTIRRRAKPLTKTA